MRRLSTFILSALMFACTVPMHANSAAVSGNKIVKSIAAYDCPFRGYDYESEYNLWKAIDLNNSYTDQHFFAPEWSSTEDYTFEKEDQFYDFTFNGITFDRWQNYHVIKPDYLHLSADKAYDFSFVVTGNTVIPDALVRICDADNHDVILYETGFSVVPDNHNVVYASGIQLPADCNAELLFDFGGNRYGAEVLLFNIVLKDHANNDGTVLPEPVKPVPQVETELNYDSTTNLWKLFDDTNGYSNDFFYGPGWVQTTDPTVVKEGSSYTITLPQATDSKWQAQWRMTPDGLYISKDNYYDVAMTIRSNVDLNDVTVNFARVPYNDVCISSATINLTANTDYRLVIRAERKQPTDCQGKLFFDFGGNPANTIVTVKDIAVEARPQIVPVPEQTDMEYYFLRQTEDSYAILGPTKPVSEYIIPSNIIIDNKVHSVDAICNCAFQGCHSLTSIEIPNTIYAIGSFAFFNCPNLYSVVLPNSLRKIQYYSFAYCKGLTYMNIPENVTEMEELAFAYCTSLSSIDLPYGLQKIGYNAFEGCSALASITLPGGLTSIGGMAFAGCSELTSVNIPYGVNSIGTQPFASCNKLQTITVDENNMTYDSRDNCNAIIETASNTLIVGCSATVIPATVTAIGDNAFYGCNISSVTIPALVTTIGTTAFADCSQLTDVTNLATVPQEINGNTFHNIPENATLHVLPGSVSAYRASQFWNRFYIVGDALDVNVYNHLYIHPVETRPGHQVTVSVKMKNTDEIQSMSLKVKLPEGITIAKNKNGEYLINLSNERTNASSHALQSNYVQGEYRIIAYNTSEATFSGNDGEVFTMTLNIAPDMPLGEYDIELTDIGLVDTRTQLHSIQHYSTPIIIRDYVDGDANGDGRVTMADANIVVNYFLGANSDGIVMKAADANGDGKVTMADANAITNIFIGNY